MKVEELTEHGQDNLQPVVCWVVREVFNVLLLDKQDW